jgi:small subunit ribosomal protein S18
MAKKKNKRKRLFRRGRKNCPICNIDGIQIDYKDIDLLKQFVARETGKILPRRISGMCAEHQRELSTAIKRARQMAMLPYADEVR